MSIQTSEISSANLDAAIAGLDLDNELLGSTEGDDGIDLLVSKSKTVEPETNADAPVVAPTVAVGTTAPSKADKARAIFNANYGTMARKDIIAKFISEAGLTKAGAGTYYQNFTAKLKKAAELTTAPATTSVDPTDTVDNDDSAE